MISYFDIHMLRMFVFSPSIKQSVHMGLKISIVFNMRLHSDMTRDIEIDTSITVAK
jgi:hypothetical protein